MRGGTQAARFVLAPVVWSLVIAATAWHNNAQGSSPLAAPQPGQGAHSIHFTQEVLTPAPTRPPPRLRQRHPPLGRTPASPDDGTGKRCTPPPPPTLSSPTASTRPGKGKALGTLTAGDNLLCLACSTKRRITSRPTGYAAGHRCGCDWLYRWVWWACRAPITAQARLWEW